MSVYKVARRYAEAAYGLAEEQKLGDRFASDLAVIQDAIKSSREFVAFLKSPIISRERKRSVLSEVFKSRLSDFTFNFLNLLVEKGREELVGDIAGEFFKIRDDRQGLVTLDVRAAVEMDSDQQKMIVKRFESLTGKKIRAAFSIDKQLKGGFVARIGDTVYDGSLLRQLELLRERFAEGVASN
jgi:F-type H+-transporting ATPase subunit delta